MELILQRWSEARHGPRKILRGANPGDVPAEQSTKVKLVINAKTARELRLELSAPLLAHADE